MPNDPPSIAFKQIKAMKNARVFIGIDVSKKTLDICYFKEGKSFYKQIPNHEKHIQKFLSGFDLDQTVVAAENTGRYNWPLYEVVSQMPVRFYVINPVHLKRSLGLIRGKDDQKDAWRIAWFIERHYQDLSPWEPEEESIQHLKILLSERRQLIKNRKQVKTAKRERTLIKQSALRQSLMRRDNRRIKALDKEIEQVELQIATLIKSDEELQQKAKLVRSVPGVGKVVCWHLLAKTNGFKSIKDPRKLACYAGVAPFEHQSGTSVRKKPTVSNMADKKLKSLLHMAAIVARQHDKELRTYYERKIKQGKNPMTVINALRNKIIHRVCAVVRNQKMFEIRLVES